ncbi:DUF1173 family protein [Pseudomonas gingeri]|uniref:DUF1173 family protein n=1 Tax=Pseudomonas gingeri TaxID=117681 RepID=UPI0015A0D0DA|nr:DUF1173 family protein [Pseudomonas gingeri]NWA02803.1 DUF1173 family protein [Pseudomonas gingeri]NWA18236.1 DUF1173 family protein [Pseudomonas gingeri]NWA58974.1 DUF1173 family protein [Pseudomonas gingeri]NWA99553.1 DUF1173 family protein [Pseudomonas gingeri]NWB05558.1 DUF1173 family protein [Pseudomonas gingeri]
MVYERFPVVIDGKPFSTAFQTQDEFASGWKAVLEKAYGRTRAVCRCPGKGERKLAIKRRDETDGFHLARFAGTGPEHANECRYYAPAPERSGMQGYEAGVVEEGDDGTLRVRLARGLVELPARTGSAGRDGVIHRPSAGDRKRSMTLLGLLCLLWQEARLNIWYPAMEGKRNSGQIHGVLRKTARRIKAGRVMLSEVLLLCATPRSGAETANRTVVEAVIKKGRRAVVISPLARFDTSKHDAAMPKLPLAGPYGIPYLKMAPEVWEDAQKRFRTEMGAWKRGERVMAIAQLSVEAGKTQASAQVTDLALMHISERWIPLDSDYESTLEKRLTAAGRSFEKPLRYDAAECEFFPDFWLLDMKDDFPLEVFGMNTPDYLAQKARKTQWYNRVYGPLGWWSWDVMAGERDIQLPELPK